MKLIEPVVRFTAVTTTFSAFAVPPSRVSTWPTPTCAKVPAGAVTVTFPAAIAVGAVYCSGGTPTLPANIVIAALAALLSAAPKALVSSCGTPLIWPAPSTLSSESVVVPCGAFAATAALESVMVNCGDDGPVCAACSCGPSFVGSRVNTIFCAVLSNDAVTPSCAALKLVMM